MFRPRAEAQNLVQHSCSEKNVHPQGVTKQKEITGAGGWEAGLGLEMENAPGQSFPFLLHKWYEKPGTIHQEAAS